VLGWATLNVSNHNLEDCHPSFGNQNLERRHPEPGFSRVKDLARGGRDYANSALMQQEGTKNQSLDCDRCHQIG
jgi:hypothetical protein